MYGGVRGAQKSLLLNSSDPQDKNEYERACFDLQTYENMLESKRYNV